MPDMLMSEMIDTMREAQRRMLDHGSSDAWISLAHSVGKVVACLEEMNQPWPEASASIRWAGFDDIGMPMGHGTRSSSNPSEDMSLMVGFLELNDAYRLRGVPMRHKLGSLWLTSDVPPQLTSPEFKGPVVHEAAKRAIQLAEANGQVLRVYSKPNPFELRMGGHYMVYELRDNLATARAKAAQMVKIVRGSNYDEEFFFEEFWQDGKELTRDEARMQVNMLNNDPKLDDRYYWRVVEKDRKLYKFEP